MEALIRNNKTYIIALCAGLALLLFSGSFSPSGSGGSVEKQLARILQQAEGIGKIEVMVTRNNKDEIEGVIVVAQGAEDPAVKRKICDAAQTAFGVQPHKVQIYPLKN